MNVSNQALIQLIEKERSAIRNAQHFYQKLEAQNSILQIKIHSNDTGLLADIYVDIKYLISYYIKASEERQYGYDEVNMAKILTYVDLLSLEQKVKSLNFLFRLLALNGFETEKDICKDALAKANCALFIREPSPMNVLKLIYLKTTSSLLSILATLLISFTVYFSVLLPNNYEVFQVFEIAYMPFSENFYLNHFTNTLLSVFQLADDFKVKPTNLWGTFLLILGKTAFLVIVVNILIKEISSKIKL
ncbi:hypothetical protein GCM10023188_14410 [Pontibacter saemangeumensis]|uniref:Ion channel n=1 Tax=Pontibacter saemangeumensis TaxID=1084525 RepID=A0ABP8LGH6_9BACT